jgi:hypothetical protein
MKFKNIQTKNAVTIKMENIIYKYINREIAMCSLEKFRNLIDIIPEHDSAQGNDMYLKSNATFF